MTDQISVIDELLTIRLEFQTWNRVQQTRNEHNEEASADVQSIVVKLFRLLL
jgi:hypothetical protein